MYTYSHSVFNYALFWMGSFLIQNEKTLLTYRVGRATNEKTCVHWRARFLKFLKNKPKQSNIPRG